MDDDEPAEQIARLEPLIFLVRSFRVVLDADLARLYGVGTKPRSNGTSTRWPAAASSAATPSQSWTSEGQPREPAVPSPR